MFSSDKKNRKFGQGIIGRNPKSLMFNFQIHFVNGETVDIIDQEVILINIGRGTKH